MIRKPLDNISIAITGDRSCKLSWTFGTDFQKEFPGATIYDRTDKVANLIRREIALGKSEFASPEFRKMAERAEKNLARPPKVEATINFTRSKDDLETVHIVGRTGRRLLLFPFDDDEMSMEDVDEYTQMIVKAVAEVA